MATALQHQEQVSQTDICHTCLNVDHSRFLDNLTTDDYESSTSRSSRPVFRLFEFDALVETADGGCPSCRLIHRAIDHFWKDEAPFYNSSQRHPENGRNFRRKLCLAHQPGFSLLLFRVLVFQDIPDTSIIQTLTIRDSTARIELYRIKPTSAPVPPIYPAIGWASHVPEHITLDKAVELARGWMSTCDLTHAACRRDMLERLPKRVVDVMEGVRLVDTIADGSTAQVEPYVTLSHCWGSHKSAELLLKTTQHNICQYRQQIPWAEIPALFRDAIALVRGLGYRYIWIDSLCIIQGDEEDWMAESAAMSEIYSNAVLNIAGIAMRNSLSSLFKPRIHGQGFRDLRNPNGLESAASLSLQSMVLERDELAGGTIFARISHDRSHEVLYGDMEYFRTPMEPMLNRAWVFQERLLSRRTLHFSASELLWECQTSCLCECTGMDRGHGLSVRSLNSRGRAAKELGESSLATPSPSRLFQPKKVLFSNICRMFLGDNPRQLLDFWLRLVEEYSFLMLSHDNDRPFALAGIANRFQSLIPRHKYLAGLWSLDLPRALLWIPYPNKTVIPADRGIPTWSWMARICFPYTDATTCAIRYSHITRHEFEPDPRLKIHFEEVLCQYYHGNCFGRPISGQIALSAPGKWAVVNMVRSTRRKPAERVWTGRQTLHLVLEVGNLAGESGSEFGLTMPFSPDCPGASPETVRLSQRVLCVLFGGRKAQSGKSGPHYGLALSPVAGQPGTFTRTGFFETGEEGATAFEGAPLYFVKIA